MKKAAMVLFVKDEKILFVKPNYRDYWLCPGGMLEPGDTPKQAALREVKEEVGLDINIKSLLCVDDRPKGFKITHEQYTRKVKRHERTFVYLGELKNRADFEKIILQEDEIDDFAFWHFEEAKPYLPNYLVSRIPFALMAMLEGNIFYLENGELITTQ